MICEYRLPDENPGRPKKSKRKPAKRGDAAKHKPVERLQHITADRVVAYLNDLVKLGRSARTYNAYLQAMQQFCAWTVIHGRRQDNPIAHIQKRNIEKDRRYVRRTLTVSRVRETDRRGRGQDSVFRRLAGRIGQCSTKSRSRPGSAVANSPV